MNRLLLGAVAMASLVASMFFVRFWKTTGDRFFLLFGIAFFVDAVSRVAQGSLTISEDYEPLIYVGRVITFGLILIAIWDKNRVRPPNQ
jgi:hypothetical protein